MKRINLLIISICFMLIAAVCFAEVTKVDDSTIAEEITMTETKSVTYKADYLLSQKTAIEKDLARVQAELIEINRLISGAEAVGVVVNIPDWVQPTAEDPYMIEDKVTWEGSVYESLIDNNVWSPSAYPAGWQLIE